MNGNQQEIPISDLVLDFENARLLDGAANTREAIAAMLKNVTPEKMTRLAADISLMGLGPEPLLVLAPTGKEREHVVLDGNRRLTAIKLLENPDLAPEQHRKQLRESAAKAILPTTVSCRVFPSRDAARPWIERKHTGERGGVGTIEWGRREKLKFLRKTTSLDQILKLLTRLGIDGDGDFGPKFPSSTLDRILNNKGSRRFLGLEKGKDGVLHGVIPPAEIAKGLTRLVRDLDTKKINVGDVYTSKQQTKYFESYSDDETPIQAELLPSWPFGEPPIKEPIHPPQNLKPKTKLTPSTTSRSTFLPSGLVIKIPKSRANDLFLEMRKLPASFPNSCAVLTRVFVDLCADEYASLHKLEFKPTETKEPTTRDKINQIVTHLGERGRIQKNQAKAIRATVAPGKGMRISDLLNAYIHNGGVSPTEQDVKALWNALQPLFEAMWQE